MSDAPSTKPHTFIEPFARPWSLHTLRHAVMFAWMVGTMTYGLDKGHWVIATVGAIGLVCICLLLVFEVILEVGHNSRILDHLGMEELMAMLGKDARTWVATPVVVRALDARFPHWKSCRGEFV